MRLLAFLSSIESHLRSSGRLEDVESCARLVDYTCATARLHAEEYRAVTLYLVRLAWGKVACEMDRRTPSQSNELRRGGRQDRRPLIRWAGRTKAGTLMGLPKDLQIAQKFWRSSE